jgi:hypothetical protein
VACIKSAKSQKEVLGLLGFLEARSAFRSAKGRLLRVGGISEALSI